MGFQRRRTPGYSVSKGVGGHSATGQPPSKLLRIGHRTSGIRGEGRNGVWRRDNPLANDERTQRHLAEEAHTFGVVLAGVLHDVLLRSNCTSARCSFEALLRE